MCFPSFPNAIGEKIGHLTPGTEIIILAGEGYPAVSMDIVDIVWQVSGYSALTAGGVALSCRHNSDIILTDRHFDRYPVSDRALRIQKEIDTLADVIDLGGAGLELTDDPDITVPDPFPSEPE